MRSPRTVIIIGIFLLAVLLLIPTLFKSASREFTVQTPKATPHFPTVGIVSYPRHLIPSPPAKPVLVNKKPKGPSPQELFRKELRNILEQLPRKTQLRSLSARDAHETPQPIQVAGLALGNIAQKIEQQPRLLPEALEFYKECAESVDFADSVRALCLANYLKRSTMAGQPVSPLDPEKIPERIRRLAGKLRF